MIRNILLLSVFALVSACQQPKVFEHHETIAGIPHSIWIHDIDEEKARRASNAVFSELRLLSHFTDPVQSKPIARSNALLRSREWFSVNPSMTGILKQGIEYARATDHIYNPAALGALRELWGFYDDKPRQPPTEQDIASLVADLPTMDDIRFDAIRLRGNHPRIRLDFDWLAHGYAIDMQAQHLRDMGIRRARLKIGAVEMNIAGPGQARCRRTLDTGHDIIDTRSGYPIATPASVEVVALTASDAAVACWALLIAEPAARQKIAKRLKLVETHISGKDGKNAALP